MRVLVHRDALALSGLEVERVIGDVRDPASLERAFQDAETVFHLAAVVSIDDNCRDIAWSVNIRGTENVVAACLTAGVKRLVHFSSIHAMQQPPFTAPVDETRELVGNGAHYYDRSKAASEGIVQEGFMRGLNAVILAPTGIIGPHDYQPSHGGQMLLAMACGKLPALVAGGFDWVDVRDVATGALAAEAKAPPGAKYILSGRWASLTALAEMTARLTGGRPPSFICPFWLAGIGIPFIGAYDKLRHRRPLYTRASLRAVRANPQMSHARATAELGYEPRALDDTIRDTLAWFQYHGSLPKRIV